MTFDIQLQRNGLKTAEELAENRSHGERIKYRAGCRCTPCRAANSRYEVVKRAAARRRGESNGFVPATKVQLHLTLLSQRGIGRDTVADLTGLAPSSLDLYRTGKRKNIRAMSEKAILAIELDSVINDAQCIPARKTWKQIRWMLREGFTRGEIARRLGYKTRSLQLNKNMITAQNAMKVERLYNSLRAGDPDLEEKDTLEQFVTEKPEEEFFYAQHSF